MALQGSLKHSLRLSVFTQDQRSPAASADDAF